MLSLLLIAALAMQYPQPAPKQPTTTRSNHATAKDTSATTSRSAAIGKQAFHDRMRELWTDHIVYTRGLIVSATAGLQDTAEVAQRLLRNQDEIGEAIKPYYGDAAGTQLASLLRNHIQLAAKALTTAKGTSTAMQPGMSQTQYQSNQYGSDTSTMKSSSQYPGNVSARVADTTKSRKQGSPSATPRAADTTRSKQPANARVTGDTMSQRLPSNQYGNARTDTTQQSGVYAQGQQSQSGQYQTGQVDSTQLNKAIADLKANGDSIAELLAKANPRGFPSETLKGAIGQHITLLLQEVTAHVKRDWSGSIAAFDESLRQASQMADMLSDGIMKQFPSRFSTKATTVSSR
ncbi:MAG TPA: hypothetical protein VG454_04340 [Gemmatimonadales bacterium]|nr:hypothetical protein [Gemmatimonadales bacterium]